MKYNCIKTAKFIKRPNRFIAHVIMNPGDKDCDCGHCNNNNNNNIHDNNSCIEEVVHVKNTGRCKEILTEGTTVILEEGSNPGRKTKYSVIAAYKGDMLINIDSQVPNAVAYEGILNGKIHELPLVTKLCREVSYGNSRFDLYFEANGQKGFIEVKGVTLETDGVAMFPDAPTQRGSKHVYEMIKAVEEGYLGYILFLIQMKGVRYFTPFVERDPELAAAIKLASQKGVIILAYDSIVQMDDITIDAPVEVRL